MPNETALRLHCMLEMAGVQEQLRQARALARTAAAQLAELGADHGLDFKTEIARATNAANDLLNAETNICSQWWMASATSGHYKQRKISHGTLTSGGAEFTDDEKLADAMATAQRHIELAAEFSESLAEVEAAAEEKAPKTVFPWRPAP